VYNIFSYTYVHLLVSISYLIFHCLAVDYQIEFHYNFLSVVWRSS
jgi:hypothetical protein